MFIRIAALALAGIALPAFAQSMPMDMPGMGMPPHSKAGPAKPKAKKNVRKGAIERKAAGNAIAHSSAQAGAAEPTPVNEGSMNMPGQPQLQSAPTAEDHHGTMNMPTGPQGSSTGGRMQMTRSDQGSDAMVMAGALGAYPMQRESSGTAWQPDTSAPMGLMTTSGSWTLMAHGTVNFVYDHQSGLRGDDKAFASGMLMGMARRPIGSGTVQFKAMISPEPLMGASGYPLLLASGETANGHDRLIDRQHPHDFFMELSASVSEDLGHRGSMFIYAGLPGEPAFGPPAFMHREAILDSPEAPISHHWLDSSHITFGVVTAGIVFDRVKIEVSRFNGREPDQHRWDIETGPLDSTAVRLSFNPTGSLALQGSWGHFVDPEQLEPGVNQDRLSASALYATELTAGWKFASTLAWGRKISQHHKDDAYVAEASLKRGLWTVFARSELTKNRELVGPVENGPAYGVGKISVGGVRDFRLSDHVSVGTGALFALNFVPSGLANAYGGSNPTGLMGFMRLRLN